MPYTPYDIKAARSLVTVKKNERKRLRYSKVVAEAVKLILKNDDKKLKNKDIETIAIKVYEKYNRIVHQRLRSMINQPQTQTDINSEIQRILTDRGIKPIEKSIDLAAKGEEVAKTTSDYMQLSKYYKDVASVSTIKASETREYDSFEDYKSDIPSKITQKIGVTGSTGANIGDLRADNTHTSANGREKRGKNKTESVSGAVESVLTGESSENKSVG